MHKSDPVENLEQLILVKQAEQEEAGRLLNDHFHLTYESLKPIHLLKSTVDEVMHSPELKQSIVMAIGAILTRIIAKKLIAQKPEDKAVLTSGQLIERVVAGLAVKNAAEITIIGTLIARRILKKQEADQA